MIAKRLGAHLDRLYFEVEGNQGEYEALVPVSGTTLATSAHGKAHLQILDEIIENAKTFRIFAVLNVHQRTNLCGLRTSPVSSAINRPILGNVCYRYLKGDVIVPNADLELLLSYNVLFRPVGVIFPLYLDDGDQVYINP